MAYIAKEIRWYKEATAGTKPASPDNFLLSSAEGFSVVETEASEDIVCIGGDGEASGKAYGSSTFAGDIPMVLTGDLMPILLHHAIGEADTMVDATAEVWVTLTAYIVGDMINHTDTTHTLVCLTAGESGGTEPVMTDLDEFDTITDGTVVWIIRPTLNLYTGERQSCLETFGLELNISGACSGESDEYERTGGCYVNTIEFGKAGGDNSLKTTVGVVGTNRDSSITNASYEAQGGTDDELSKEYFGHCDLDVYIDNVIAENITNLKTPINRNITAEDTLVCDTNIVNVGIISVDGSIAGLFSTDLYLKGSNHTTHELKLIYSHKGDVTTITYPNIVFEKSPIKVEAQKNAMIDGKFSAIGSSAVPSVNYTCISGISY